MSKNNVNELKEEYKEYTPGLAFFDLVPVVVFLMSGIVIYTMFDSPVFLAGVLACFAGGMSKVIWKMLVVFRRRDYAVLTKAFRILMFGGFGLMIVSVLLRAGSGSLAGLWKGFTLMPATIFFIAGFAGMFLMGWLGSHMDQSAKSNWIEEGVNAAAQTAFLIGIIIVYFGTFYHGTDTAYQALEDAPPVNVSQIEAGYFLDGPGTEKALVFYPGAKVEAEAYAPLLRRVAESGTDCFLCSMPLNFALLGKDLGSDLKEEYDYEKWYISGHSLGGVAASMLASEEADEAETADSDSSQSWAGVIFLASYPTGKVTVPSLSIYGTNDEVLNHENYQSTEDEGLWPEDFTEIVIEGGNHAQFGSYGEQKGDGQAEISEEEQQEQTANCIIEWLKEN